jgi:hypothetical protein
MAEIGQADVPMNDGVVYDTAQVRATSAARARRGNP